MHFALCPFTFAVQVLLRRVGVVRWGMYRSYRIGWSTGARLMMVNSPRRGRRSGHVGIAPSRDWPVASCVVTIRRASLLRHWLHEESHELTLFGRLRGSGASHVRIDIAVTVVAIIVSGMPSVLQQRFQVLSDVGS